MNDPKGRHLDFLCDKLKDITEDKCDHKGGETRLIVNIQDDILKLHSMGLVDRLLEDKTTKENIIWATDAYNALGEEYGRYAQITSDSITGERSNIIKTRARKELEQQSERTRQHAEVFTPLWVCNRMNNDIDEVWFGYRDVFNDGNNPTNCVVFPEGKDWKQYVDSRRLEITCGEAPYLVSRYDVENGEVIPTHRRIGILDRKLRVVNENASTDEEWLKWTIRAFQATYGYEFQGDNLLIARVNMVMTFEEYFEERMKRKPDLREYGKIITIVAWNIWQMDGLTGTIPYHEVREVEQVSLFDLFDLDSSEKQEENKQSPCKIYDWRKDNALTYISLRRNV